MLKLIALLINIEKIVLLSGVGSNCSYSEVVSDFYCHILIALKCYCNCPGEFVKQTKKMVLKSFILCQGF